ncbi:hypothetical protein [Streptomyces sp. NPDC005385]|uniref:hypothetical protein n=1 Tax=unclassified Streptomyces TaxID=2593676 RepID=UPI0033A85987
MTACPDHRIAQWLARSARVPAEADREWREQGVALLTMGDRLQAVRLSPGLVHAVVGNDDPDQVAASLTEIVGGPIIRDRPGLAGSLYYALISGHAGVVWDYAREAPVIGQGIYLGIPAPHRRKPPGPYWLIPPRYDGDVCRPESVRQLVARGLEIMAPVKRA